MSVLTELPEEILLNILECLAPRFRFDDASTKFGHGPKGQLRTLSCASRTCRLLRTIALPVLYHTIPVMSIRLLYALAKKESLAALVKAINLFPIGMKTRDLRKILRIVRRKGLPLPWEEVEGDKHDIIRFVPRKDPRICYKHNATWNNHVCDVHVGEAIMHLLLLPNLEQIVNLGSSRMEHRIISDFFRQPRMAPTLKALRLSPLHDDWYLEYENDDIGRFRDVLQPTLKQLQAECVSWKAPNPTGQTRPSESALPERLGLQNIELIQADVDAPALEDILTRCPELQSLRIVWDHPTYPDPNAGCRYDLTAMGNVLRHHGRKLQSLFLDFEEWYGLVHQESEMIPGRLGSLRELKFLKSLGLSQFRMLHFYQEDQAEPLTLDHCLPDSLEDICLLSVPSTGEAQAVLHQQVYEMIQAKDRRRSLGKIDFYSNKLEGHMEVLGFRFDLIPDSMPPWDTTEEWLSLVSSSSLPFSKSSPPNTMVVRTA